MDYILRKYNKKTFYLYRNKKISMRLIYSNLNCLQYCLPKLNKSTICENIAFYGNLDVLKLARGQSPSCPWDRWTCAFAALGGHLELLKWTIENGCPWDDRIFINAELLKWIRENVCDGKFHNTLKNDYDKN